MVILGLSILFSQQGGATIVKIPNPGFPDSRFAIRVPENRLSPAKKTPKKFGVDKSPFEFDWVVGGFSTQAVGGPSANENLRLRFNVFSQERKSKDDISVPVARMLLRLWGHNFDQMRLAHSDQYGFGSVDVYLCWGGTAGGEQRFDADAQTGKVVPVNTIYIYDLPSFKEPIEKAREIAHEYGHASIPSTGGFKDPEDWGNGYLGERIFLYWARAEMGAKRLTPDDFMGASFADLDAWVKKSVEPLVTKGLAEGPSLARKATPNMDDYMALCLSNYVLSSPKVFTRGLMLAGSTELKDIPGGMVLAAEEPEEITYVVPSFVSLKAIWIPLGSGKVKVGKVIKKDGGWSQVQLVEGKITVQNVRSS